MRIISGVIVWYEKNDERRSFFQVAWTLGDGQDYARNDYQDDAQNNGEKEEEKENKCKNE